MRARLAVVLLLLCAVTSAARAATLDDDLRAAQQLAWQKRFAEAEALYRRVVERSPESRAAVLGLAQVLLWEERYRDAAELYRRLLRNTPADADARKGLATAEYWSGDFRAAQRDFAALPDDAGARKALADIRAAMAPVVASDNAFMTDDQPLHRTTAQLSATVFSDPLTKWTGTAGTYLMSADASAPFASIAGDTFLPTPRLRARATLRVLRFPDGTTRPLGGMRIAREWRHSSIAAEIDRHEILYTVTALTSHPYETTVSATWTRESERAQSAAAVRVIDYFDDNRGRSADAYHLVNFARRFSAGASASYRDTSEMRFDGRYDPYWTPRDLVDVRGVLAARMDAGPAKVSLHADGGWARDREPLFGTPRTFHPWRVSADAAVPLRGSFTVTLGVERQSTVFYRATAFRAGFSGRL